jgi:hypothetical protein
MSAAFNIYIPELSGDIAQPDLAGRTEIPAVSSDRSSGYITDISFLAELWNAGPHGRTAALQIADHSISTVQTALAETKEKTK